MSTSSNKSKRGVRWARLSWYTLPGCLLTALALFGCTGVVDDDPMVGDWKSADRVGSERNEMSIDSDMTGEALIYFFYDGALYYAEFAVELRQHTGDKYEFAMECATGCGLDLDFRMDCDLSNSSMRCDGDGLWRDYGFDWIRD